MANGVDRVVCGHKPAGDCPLVIKSKVLPPAALLIVLVLLAPPRPPRPRRPPPRPSQCRQPPLIFRTRSRQGVFPGRTPEIIMGDTSYSGMRGRGPTGTAVFELRLDTA